MRPILYAFRRCPYAMRARLALYVSQAAVELREIRLRDKPQAFLDVSPSATVPCLVTEDRVLDESLDIMIWALERNDPERWLDMPQAGFDLIQHCDGPFKQALDRTKYAVRYPDSDPVEARTDACTFIDQLEAGMTEWIFDRPSLADFAILPFIRQFAMIDRDWFEAQEWPRVQAWLARELGSDRFAAIMVKYDPWGPETDGVAFP